MLVKSLLRASVIGASLSYPSKGLRFTNPCLHKSTKKKRNLKDDFDSWFGFCELKPGLHQVVFLISKLASHAEEYRNTQPQQACLLLFRWSCMHYHAVVAPPFTPLKCPTPGHTKQLVFNGRQRDEVVAQAATSSVVAF